MTVASSPMTSVNSFGSSPSTALTVSRPGSVPTQNKTIVLKSCYGKTGTKIYLQPCRDGRTANRFLGVAVLSEEQKRNAAYVVEPGTTQLEISDGFVFDLRDERQAIDWEWVRRCPQIADNRSQTDFHMDAQESRSFEGSDTEFYVHDEEAEVANQEARLDKEFEALKFIHGLKGSSAIYQTARLLGSNMESSSTAAVRTFLISKANKHPEQILKVATDGSSKARLFMYAALDKEVIRRRAGVYYYNETALGTTEDQVLVWLSEDRNFSLVKAMQLELHPTAQLKPQISEANQQLFRDSARYGDQEFSSLSPEDSFEIEDEEEMVENLDADANMTNAALPSTVLTRAAQMRAAKAAKATTPTA